MEYFGEIYLLVSSFDEKNDSMARAIFHFPRDFLWGTATAAHQVEGHNTNNDWWNWEQAGQIVHQQKAGIACNWWDLATAARDLDTAAEMGTNAHRLSIEWSRIEPEPSVFDEDALAYYRHLLEACHARGLEPMVTLHHFTNPQWLVSKGDFQSELVVDYFQRFTKKVVDTLGDLIPKWITFNEPLVYFFLRYLDQVFPQPEGKSGLLVGRRALRNMLRCHAAAYHVIKSAYPHALVGVAKQLRPIDPQRPQNLLDKWWAAQLDWAFNEAWMEAMHSGRSSWLFGRAAIKGLANSFDFVGVNYYTHDYATFLRFPNQHWPDGAVVSDGNYGELYPEGLAQVIRYANRFNKPIYITENGLPDRADKLRPSFIITHLHQVWRMINFSLPVMGYYHWSLIDNFEWERGWTQRFGLLEMDPETQERHLRPSGRLYGEICRNYQINTAMIEKYAIQLMPKLLPGRTPTAL